MKRLMRTLGVSLAAVFAFSAIAVASASAAEFTASAVGELTGEALESQVFTTNAGTVVCKNAHTTGTITSTKDTEQKVTVNYSNCTALGFVDVDISTAHYNFTASGSVHVEKPITITVTVPLLTCTITVPAQTVGTVGFETVGNNVKVTPEVTGITYTTSGGLCGSGGSNGTYVGANEVHRVGGGSVAYHP